MSHFLRAFTIVLALAGISLFATTGTALAAAGAPPSGPLPAPKSGAELKHACGQGIANFSGLVGEKARRDMLISQCRAMVTGIVELVNGGQYAIDNAPVWQCVKNPKDNDALTGTFVTWVGRRPALLRKPASIAFVEAIEMSEKCRN